MRVTVEETRTDASEDEAIHLLADAPRVGRKIRPAAGARESMVRVAILVAIA